jgi:hypothetical protein
MDPQAKAPSAVIPPKPAAEGEKLPKDADKAHGAPAGAATAVYYPPNQAEGNPGVQGFVHRPHQEKNPGAGGVPAREADEFQQQLRREKDARKVAADADRARQGESGPALVGPTRLHLRVDVSAECDVEEEKASAVASAADTFVMALRDAGAVPKASVVAQSV